MESFLTDITNSVYMDGLKAAGYGVGRGSASPGVIDPTSIANNTMLSDSAIQGMLQSARNLSSEPSQLKQSAVPAAHLCSSQAKYIHIQQRALPTRYR